MNNILSLVLEGLNNKDQFRTKVSLIADSTPFYTGVYIIHLLIWYHKIKRGYLQHSMYAPLTPWALLAF